MNFVKNVAPPPAGLRVVKVEEMHAQMKAQGVSAREHIAFVCVSCSTVQSMALLRRYGCSGPEKAIGFSCVGRFSGAGPFRKGKKPDPARPGCDWTLGGLFRIHKLEVETADGKRVPSFELATPDQAQVLEAEMQRAPAPAAPARTEGRAP